MARQNRIWYPGATYHVMSRGNWRKSIFRDQADYIRFLECIDIIKQKIPFKIHAICLMTNHFHMLIETQDIHIGIIMGRILSLYVEEYNHRYSLSGHLFYGRYKSKLIEDEIYFLECSRYIHLNPVKAKMVREAGKYPHSSYCYYVNKKKLKLSYEEQLIEKLITQDRVFSLFRNNPPEEYSMFVAEKDSHSNAETLIRKDMGEDEMWLTWEKMKTEQAKKSGDSPQGDLILCP